MKYFFGFANFCLKKFSFRLYLFSKLLIIIIFLSNKYFTNNFGFLCSYFLLRLKKLVPKLNNIQNIKIFSVLKFLSIFNLLKLSHIVNLSPKCLLIFKLIDLIGVLLLYKRLQVILRL